MESVDYYKSLISDEEVIKALLKESKAREGGETKAKTRVRPNLNFFQRTVTNLVSSNKRIPVTAFKDTEDKPLYSSSGGRALSVRKIRSPCAIIKDILLENRINFVKAGESKDAAGSRFSPSAKPKNKIEPKSTKEIAGTNLNGAKRPKSASTVSGHKKRKLHLDECSDSVISISSSDSSSSESSTQSEVIFISDADSDIILSDSVDRPGKKKPRKRRKNVMGNNPANGYE